MKFLDDMHTYEIIDVGNTYVESTFHNSFLKSEQSKHVLVKDPLL